MWVLSMRAVFAPVLANAEAVSLLMRYGGKGEITLGFQDCGREGEVEVPKGVPACPEPIIKASYLIMEDMVVKDWNGG
jgi:hypothetical protein